MTSSIFVFGKSILFIVDYLSAKFQVNSTSQSKDTLGGPFGPPPASESPQKPSLNRVKCFKYKMLYFETSLLQQFFLKLQRWQ